MNNIRITVWFDNEDTVSFVVDAGVEDLQIIKSYINNGLIAFKDDRSLNTICFDSNKVRSLSTSLTDDESFEMISVI